MRPVVALATGLLLARIALLFTPGYGPDLLSYESWALQAGVHGVHTVYDPPEASGVLRTESVRFDYPPVYAYLLAPIGAAYGRAEPGIVENYKGTQALGALVKLPPLMFDLLI